jgi:hypothetical protein
MSSCSQLPTWVSYLQALAVPILALVGAWIAAQQMLIAHDKLRHDAFEKLYDRRVAVYEATRAILADVFRGNISEEKIHAYGLRTLDAQFLFDEVSCKYLKKVRDHVAALSMAETSIEHEASPSDTKTEWERIRAEHLDWIRQQGDGQTDFTKWFMPFLKYKPVKRPWFLRLPSQS